MYPTPLFCSTRIKCSLVAALFSRNISLPLPLPLIRWKASTGSNHLIFLTRLRTIFVFRCRNIQIWSGKDGGGQLPWKWMQHLALRLAFPSLSSSSFPSRRWNKRSNKTTLPSSSLQGFSPPDFGQIAITPLLFPRWTVSSQCPYTRWQIFFYIPFRSRYEWTISRSMFINLVCSFSYIYIYISLRIIRTNIKFHGIWLEEKRFT